MRVWHERNWGNFGSDALFICIFISQALQNCNIRETALLFAAGTANASLQP